MDRAHAALGRHQEALSATLERSAENALDDSMLALAPADPELDPARAAQVEAEIWAESSLLMHRVLQAANIPYLHLLQPNQYYGQRRFSEAEAAIALRDDHPYRAAAARGYPRLVAAIPDLRAAGVRVLDGVDAFDDEVLRVYADDCCHYSRRGLEIIADRLSEAVRQGGATRASPTRDLGKNVSQALP